MGYGEFGGGGSVKWRVKHGLPAHSGSDSAGSKPGAKGRDEDGTGSRFHVYVNGVLVADVDCNTGWVKVAWGNDLQRAKEEATKNLDNRVVLADISNDTDIPTPATGF